MTKLSNKFSWKKASIHLIMLLVFFGINVALHYPYFLEGKRMQQHDIMMSLGAKEQINKFSEESGEQVLWNPAVFGGMPNYLGVQFNGNLINYLQKIVTVGINGRAYAYIFVAFVSFYILLLTYGVNPIISAIGSILYGLNGFNVIGIMAGHSGKIAAVAFIPLVIAGLHLIYSDKNKWLGLGLTAAALALQLRENHVQITYYLVIIIAVFGLNELIAAVRTKQLPAFAKNSAFAIIAAVLAGITSYGKLQLITDYSSYSTRGKAVLEVQKEEEGESGLDKEYAFRYSNGIFEPLFLYVPNFFGGSSQQELSTKSNIGDALRKNGYNRSQVAQQVKAIPTYWGDQPGTAPYYGGTLMVLLFIMALCYLDAKSKGWLIVLVVVGIALSWGKNFAAFNYFLFDYLPGYNKFRSSTFSIIITMFALTLAGGIGFQKMIDGEWGKDRKKFFLGAGISLGILIFFLLLAGMLPYRGGFDGSLPDWFISALKDDRKSLLIKDTLRALLFGTGAIVLMWAYLNKKLKLTLSLAVILGIAVIDSFSLSRRFLKPDSYVKNASDQYFRPSEADKRLEQVAGNPGERVLNLQNPFNDNKTSYFHESVGGYHGAKMRRYQDLIENCLQEELATIISTLQGGSRNLSGMQTLNMLNTRAFYFGKDANGVFENRHANGVAWTVEEIKAVESAQEEMDALKSIDTKKTAIINSKEFDIPNSDGRGSVILESKTPNELTYKANITGGKAFVVFSEIHFPDWQATVDGEKVPVSRVNYLLRGIEVPEGNHDITFSIHSKVASIGNVLALIGSSIIIILLFGSLFIQLKERADAA